MDGGKRDFASSLGTFIAVFCPLAFPSSKPHSQALLYARLSFFRSSHPRSKRGSTFSASTTFSTEQAGNSSVAVQQISFSLSFCSKCESDSHLPGNHWQLFLALHTYTTLFLSCQSECNHGRRSIPACNSHCQNPGIIIEPSFPHIHTVRQAVLME